MHIKHILPIGRREKFEYEYKTKGGTLQEQIIMNLGV